MNSIEAMLCFAAFLAVLGLFLGIMDFLSEKAVMHSEVLASGMEAQSCAAFIHGLYANTAEGIKGGNIKCFVNSSGVFGSNGKYSTELFVEGVKINQVANEAYIEVDVNAHYR